MGIKKKQVPGCGCCGSTVPPPNNCCLGTVPATMTIQIVTSGTTTFQPMLDSIGVECEYACLDLQGTWVLSRESPDVCIWCAETQVAKVVGSCDEPYYDLYTISFRLTHDGVNLRFRVVWYPCDRLNFPDSFFVATIAKGLAQPVTPCADWAVAFPFTMESGWKCSSDVTSVTISTP